jgi:hypothetical protein
MYACIYIYIYICIYIHMYIIYVYVYICMCIYIYICIGAVDCKIFLNKFIKIGTKIRSEKHFLIIEKQKNYEKSMKMEIDLRNDLFNDGKNFLLDVSTDVDAINGTCH